MSNLTSYLSDSDLLSRLKNFEDNFVERKSAGDSRDWLKTVVAFANSTPVGYPGVLFIGVKDNGTPETGCNLDSLQQTFARKIQEAYPPVYFATKILQANGERLIATRFT
jgi:predicted HTH transcriptional regulator